MPSVMVLLAAGLPYFLKNYNESEKAGRVIMKESWRKSDKEWEWELVEHALSKGGGEIW